MSVKQELEELINRRKELENWLKPITTGLAEMYSERNSLGEKVEKLRNRTSNLAKELLEETKEKLSVINQSIADGEESKAEFEEKIAEVNNEISKRIDFTDLYIKEQSEAMTKSFLEYIKVNSESIGNEISKTFKVSAITYFKDDRYGGCHVPTGNIGIFEENKIESIISSTDFYFKGLIAKVERGEYDELVCSYTDWFKEYLKKFKATFLETLNNQFSSENFNLTIDNPNFTLELV